MAPYSSMYSKFLGPHGSEIDFEKTLFWPFLSLNLHHSCKAKRVSVYSLLTEGVNNIFSNLIGILGHPETWITYYITVWSHLLIGAPIYYSCLEESWNAVLLWSFRNVFKGSVDDDRIFNFGWTVLSNGRWY